MIVKWLELKIPPLLVLLLFTGLMWLLAAALPAFTYSFAYNTWCFLSLSILGGIIAVFGVIEFRRHQTTVDPTEPEKCTQLVTSGVYALTRNPMYLGFLLFLIGWVLYLSHAMVWLGLPLFVLYLNRFQIQPEEQILLGLFPDSFAQYQGRVGRWLKLW